MKSIILYIFLLVAFTCVGQDNKYFGKPVTVPTPEVMAEYPGGNAKLQQFIRDIFPYQQNNDSCYYSKVILMFDIDENGKVTNPDCYLFGSEACTEKEKFKIDLKNKILTMPDWKPAQTYGKNVKLRMNYPVTICWR